MIINDILAYNMTDKYRYINYIVFLNVPTFSLLQRSKTGQKTIVLNMN